MCISPFLAKIALKFSFYEYFAVGVFSMTMMASLISGSVVKGLASGAIGFLIAMVGAAPIDGLPRLTLLFPSTYHLVGAEQFHLMKPTAYIINAARGPVVDEAALIEALKNGAIAGAGLDVFEQEPPAPDNLLFSMENVILSPHNAALSDGALWAMAMDSAAGIVDYLEGRTPKYPCNPDVLPTRES